MRPRPGRPGRVRQGPDDDPVLPVDLRLRLPQGPATLAIRSFDDPRSSTLKIGVQLIGDDNTAPAHALAAAGIVDNVVGFTVYGDYDPNPPARDRRRGGQRRGRRRGRLGAARRLLRRAAADPSPSPRSPEQTRRPPYLPSTSRWACESSKDTCATSSTQILNPPRRDRQDPRRLRRPAPPAVAQLRGPATPSRSAARRSTRPHLGDPRCDSTRRDLSLHPRGHLDRHSPPSLLQARGRGVPRRPRRRRAAGTVRPSTVLKPHLTPRPPPTRPRPAHGTSRNEPSGTSRTPTRRTPTPCPRGRRLYDAFNCVGCHAHGGGGIGPPLMDDKWIYGTSRSRSSRRSSRAGPTGCRRSAGGSPTTRSGGSSPTSAA